MTERLLTDRQAFGAMALYLARYDQRFNEAQLADVLGDLNRSVWLDGDPVDPAAWTDWTDCVTKMLIQGDQANVPSTRQTSAR